MSQTLKISLAVAIGLTIASQLSGDELSLGPRHGVLLLRNGEMVEGDVLLSGDRYDVGVAGGQIHIKRSEVEYFGRSVMDCYQQRRSHAEPGKVQENLELAEWCLRQQLYEQAALALADAVDADPQHPRIALLERRLKFALEKPAEAPAKTAQPDDSPPIDDLNRTIDGLPPRSVEMFTTAIQPVLMNHCSTAGCHGPQSSTPLKLLRTSAGKTASRRATQRNLYSVLSLIDRERPAESQLLTVPTRPHGNVKSAIFCGARSKSIPATGRLGLSSCRSTTAGRNQRRLRTVWSASTQSRPPPPSHKGPRVASDSSPDAQESKPASPRRAASQPKRDDTAEAEPADGVDLFDPAVFNQRYHPADDPE